LRVIERRNLIGREKFIKIEKYRKKRNTSYIRNFKNVLN